MGWYITNKLVLACLQRLAILIGSQGLFGTQQLGTTQPLLSTETKDGDALPYCLSPGWILVRGNAEE